MFEKVLILSVLLLFNSVTIYLEKANLKVTDDYKDNKIVFQVEKTGTNCFLDTFANDSIVLLKEEIFIDTLKKELIILGFTSIINSKRSGELKYGSFIEVNGKKINVSHITPNFENEINLKEVVCKKSIDTKELNRIITKESLYLFKENIFMGKKDFIEDSIKFSTYDINEYKIVLLFGYRLSKIPEDRNEYQNFNDTLYIEKYKTNIFFKNGKFYNK
jgi:hypothetical protein